MASWNDLQAARQEALLRYYNSAQQPILQNQAIHNVPYTVEEEKEKKNKGGILGGIGYALEKLGAGALRSIEGISDYIVGGVADIIGQDDFAEELMKSDWVNYSHADEWYNPDKVMGFVGDVAGGVGGMLPSIAAAAAVTFATGGAGAGAGASMLAQGVGTATFGLGAAGQSTSQAVKETGTLGGKQWLYGTGKGALEAGIEAISGGIGGTMAGTVLGKQMAKSTAGKIATTFLGEGLEEVASDITDPLLKRATGVDKNADIDWKGMPRTFLVGGTTGAVLGGAGRAINAAKAGGFNNLNAAENTQKLVEQKAKVNLQQVEGKGFEETSTKKETLKQAEQAAPTEQKASAEQPTVAQAAQPTQPKVETVETTEQAKAVEKPIKAKYTPEEITAQEQRVSKNLQKMDEKTRQEFMGSNPQTTRNFNDDGTVKPAVTVTQEELDSYDKNAYSASLKGHEGEFAYKPSKQPTNVVRNVMKKLTQLTQGKAEIVLTDDDFGATSDGKKINGVAKDGIIYLNAKATDAERAMFVGSHEIMHLLEGTREYNNLAKFIQSQIKNEPKMRLKYNIDNYINAYAGSQEQNYSAFTKQYEAQTEMYADFVANEILSKPESVQRLVNENRNIVVKMLDWVRNALKRIGMTKEERETYDTLRNMEKLLSNALDAGRGAMALGTVERRYQEKQQAETQAQEKEKPAETLMGRLVDVRYSIQKINGKDIVVIDTDQDIFTGKEKSEYPKIVRRYMLDKFRGKVLPIGNSKAYVNKDGLEEYAFPANRRMDQNIKAAKMKAGTELDNLLKTAEYIKHENDDGRHPEAVRGWDKYETQFIVDNERFQAEISIELLERGDLFYDISKIKNITPGTSGKALLGQSTSRQSDVIEGKPSNTIIREKNNLSIEKAKKEEKRYSLPVNVESDVKKYYGNTYNWRETGYILQDGTRLDLSGKNEGASGGYRAVDHRDIFTIYEDEDYSYGTEALNEFIARGNIRVMPETPGITLQVEPNAEQYRLIQDFVERIAWKGGYFAVDIDDSNGRTIETLEYNGRVSGRKVVSDLKYYFKEGKLPYQSALSNFRYSLDVTAEEPTYMTDEEWEASLEKEHEDDGRVANFQRVTQEKEKPTKKERIEKVKATVADAWLRGQIESTNQQAGIEHAGKKLGVDLEPKIQKARASQSAAINMVTNEQRDYTGKKRVGKSINEIFTPILKKGDETYDAFLEYLGHFHNVDSMSFEKKAKAEMIQLVKSNEKLKEIVTQKNITETERNAKLKEFEEGLRYLALKDIENKPVYGWSVGVEESQERIKELNEKYPEFFARAQEVWNYNKNLVQRRVDSGLITQELADVLLAKYPHYIPTFRDTSKSGVASTGTSNSKNAVEVRKTIKTRKGSSLDILDVMVSMSKQTQSVLRAEAVNDLANALYDAAEASNDFTDIEVISKTKVAEEIATAENGDIDYEAEKPKNNEVVFYRNGERIVAAVSQPVFIGFEGFNGGMQFKGPIVNTLEKIMKTFKSSVTSWNPLFTIRNFARDFQEAVFYTQNGVGKFVANLPKAFMAMKRNSDLWQQYLAVGGAQSGFFDKETSVYDTAGKVKKGVKAVATKLGAINEFVEQLPRFNEFMLSIENGKSIDQALLDSADVTTNFSRGGRVTKVMNRTLMPFMNASVQGFSKLWRTATGRKTARQWANLIVKATLFGFSVGLINDLLNGDDEDYKNLNAREKDNYYLFKAGDLFVKIPKGRVVAFLGSFVGRTKDFVSGKEDAFDEWVTSAMSMVTPVDSVTRTIFAPFSDIKSNKTWYGGQIEGQRLQNYAPSQRYDESTSSIAIALGKVFNYSPKKIHYLIDQYSGVFGDVLLPLTTNKAERGETNIPLLSALTIPAVSAFTIDPVTQNNISNEFYDTLDSLTWAKNAGDPISAILLRYMNKASNGVSDLYQQKRDIANDKSLSNKEKQEQTRILQATINGTLNAATQSVEKLEQILIDSGYEKQSIALMQSKAFLAFDEKQQTSATQKFTDHFYAKAMAELVGEQQAVKVALYDEFGAVEASIYLTEIAAIMSEKDANGKTIPNSRKEKVHAYIEKLKISALNKYILMYLAGYIPSENGKAKIQQYLIGKGYKQEEVKNLWN